MQEMYSVVSQFNGFLLGQDIRLVPAHLLATKAAQFYQLIKDNLAMQFVV